MAIGRELGGMLRALMETSATAQREKVSRQNELMQLMKQGFQPKAGTPYAPQAPQIDIEGQSPLEPEFMTPMQQQGGQDPQQGGAMGLMQKLLLPGGPRPQAQNFEPSALHPIQAEADRQQAEFDANIKAAAVERDFQREENKKAREHGMDVEGLRASVQRDMKTYDIDKETEVRIYQSNIELKKAVMRLQQKMLVGPVEQKKVFDAIRDLEKLRDEYIEEQMGFFGSMIPEMFGLQEAALRAYSASADMTLNQLDAIHSQMLKSVQGSTEFHAQTANPGQFFGAKAIVDSILDYYDPLDVQAEPGDEEILPTNQGGLFQRPQSPPINKEAQAKSLNKLAQESLTPGAPISTLDTQDADIPSLIDSGVPRPGGQAPKFYTEEQVRQMFAEYIRRTEGQN